MCQAYAKSYSADIDSETSYCVFFAWGDHVTLSSLHNAYIMQNNLADVVTAIKLSQRTVRKIRMNFVWAVLYNTIGELVHSFKSLASKVTLCLSLTLKEFQ